MNTQKLHISTTASDAYAVARKYGLGIEIADFCTAWNMDDELAETEKHLRSNLNGISSRLLHAPFNELFPCAIDRKAGELTAYRYMQAVELSERYRASKVIIHGGYNPYIYYPEWYVEKSILFWKSFIKHIPETVNIVLENTLEQTPELLLDIIKGVDDVRLRLCLDVGHINAYSEIPATKWIEDCAGFISHFHLHNNDSSCDSHSALDQGTVPMRKIFELIDEICPDASYTLELMDAETAVSWIMQSV